MKMRVDYLDVAGIRWTVNGNDNPDGSRTYNIEQVQLAVLMDIRQELNRLNSLLRCTNFLNIPHDLKKLRIATERKHTKKAKPCPQ